MNKLFALCVVVLCIASFVDAKSKVAERISQQAAAETQTEQSGATKLVSGCGSDPCANNDGGDGLSWKERKAQEIANMGPRPRVEDALKPIDEWIQDFSKRTDDAGGLWDAAKATVAPLVKKLEKSQKEAIERLKVSNRAIREHVEDAATQHVYNLLKSKRAIDDAEMNAAEKKEKLAEADESLASAKESKAAAKDSAKAMAETLKREKAMEEEARKKAGLPASKDNTTSTILEHINKILGK